MSVTKESLAMSNDNEIGDGEDDRENFIEQYLRSNNEEPVEAISEKIMRTFIIYSRPAGSRFPSPFHDRNFDIEIWDIAQRLPADHAAQERFVILLSALANMKVDGRNWVGLDYDHCRLRFLATVEYGNKATVREIEEDLNMVSFAGKLFESGFDLGFFPLYALKSALEEEFEYGETARGELIGDGEDHLIQRAASWVIPCASSFWVEVVRSPEKLKQQWAVNNYAALSGGVLYHGKYTGIERWKFWVSRFNEMAAREDLLETTRKQAGLAARAMQREQDRGMMMGKIIKPKCLMM